MISDFSEFCLWMYVLVDDIWQQIAPLFDRPGPEPLCSDSELLSMALIGECRGWNLETEMLEPVARTPPSVSPHSIAEPFQPSPAELDVRLQLDPPGDLERSGSGSGSAVCD